MSTPTYYYLPREIEGIESLLGLALDLRWSWDHAADELWEQLNPELWAVTHNPWVVLQTASHTRLKTLTADPSFHQKIAALAQKQQEYLAAPTWFQQVHDGRSLTCVAYFSMEFMLSEALPLYSGGLGNVAGDQLKAASDLGVPVVGIGLLYQQGYFRQVIGADGAQQAFYPYNDPMQLPIVPVRDVNGEWVRLEIRLPGYTVWLRAWRAQVGRVTLYLLDSNDPANPPFHRGITSELYGGGPELRLMQEIVLGIGGWRLLRMLGIQPDVCHLNEGHAAFAVLERARSFMADTGQPFDVALTVTRAGNLFTTHTPVAAGFDRFAPALIEHYLGAYARDVLHVSLHEFLALGRAHPDDATEPFNVAYLAVRGSGAVNGVSRLHGQVSRRLFQALFPRWPVEDVPIGYVTNGVHTPSWSAAAAEKLWAAACGPECWSRTIDMMPTALRRVSDEALWQLRTTARHSLIQYARGRIVRQLTAAGVPLADNSEAQPILDANVLTIGCARRFAAYKRPNLLLHDPDRLARMLTNPRSPVQLVIAGKAHPQDEDGQTMVQAWVCFMRQHPAVRSHAIFLGDYDMLVAEQLVQGVDLWINTPRRLWEASGTSGMKVLVNGGLNLSELDGWWAEAYTPEVGWAVGDGQEHGEDPAWDAVEAETLYRLLEQEVIPAFYARDARGIPARWVARQRESMARLTPHFSAHRAVREYTEHYYRPCAAAYRKRAIEQAACGVNIVQWQRTIAQHWATVRFGALQVEAAGDYHVFHVQVYLDALAPETVHVELYADAVDGEPAVRQVMERGRQLVGAVNSYLFSAQAPAARPATDYTPRIIPSHSDATVPLEAVQIRWQR